MSPLGEATHTRGPDLQDASRRQRTRPRVHSTRAFKKCRHPGHSLAAMPPVLRSLHSYPWGTNPQFSFWTPAREPRPGISALASFPVFLPASIALTAVPHSACPPPPDTAARPAASPSRPLCPTTRLLSSASCPYALFRLPFLSDPPVQFRPPSLRPHLCRVRHGLLGYSRAPRSWPEPMSSTPC